MDDERMKRGTYLTEKYFDEQLERIREIRASERKFYQKITDLYATAIDYDKNSATTRRFYVTVQNKMHYAVHGHTAAELIVERADHPKEHQDYCYYLLEDDTNTNIIVRSVDLDSFEDKLVYSAGSGNTEDFYGLRKDDSNDANEIPKNIATVNWLIVTDKFVYYQKDSSIYKCSRVSGRNIVIAEAVSDGEIRYQKGVLHYMDAWGKMASYDENDK